MQQQQAFVPYIASSVSPGMANSNSSVRIDHNHNRRLPQHIFYFFYFCPYLLLPYFGYPHNKTFNLDNNITTTNEKNFNVPS
eukprot:scaffold1406_cov284-Chaetoceros_neogracile.AAC.33